MKKNAPKHLRLIRDMPCLACPTEPCGLAHHVRTAWNAGGGMKPADIFALPVCLTCHGILHNKGEMRFWEEQGINPFEELTKIMSNIILEK